MRNCTLHRMFNDYGGTTLQKSCHGPQNHQEKSVQWRNGCSAAHQNDARLSKRHQTKLYFNIHNRRTRRTGQWFIFVFLSFFIVYSKHWLSTVAHTIDCKILNHGLNHGSLFSLFMFFGVKKHSKLTIAEHLLLEIIEKALKNCIVWLRVFVYWHIFYRELHSWGPHNMN